MSLNFTPQRVHWICSATVLLCTQTFNRAHSPIYNHVLVVFRWTNREITLQVAQCEWSRSSYSIDSWKRSWNESSVYSLLDNFLFSKERNVLSTCCFFPSGSWSENLPFRRRAFIVFFHAFVFSRCALEQAFLNIQSLAYIIYLPMIKTVLSYMLRVYQFAWTVSFLDTFKVLRLGHTGGAPKRCPLAFGAC